MDTLFKILVAGLLGLFVLANQAQASVLVEPYLGLSIGAGGEAKLDTATYDYSFSTATYGGRLGYQWFGAMVGLDYSLQKFTMQKEGPGVAQKLDADRSQIGLFLGYDFPLLIRGWMTYYLSGEIDMGSERFSGASGYAVGVGLKALPLLSFNLGYRSITYDKYSGLGSVVYSGELTSNEVIFYGSLPLTFFD